MRRVVLATSRSRAWATALGIQHARGRILVVPAGPAHAAAVAARHDVVVTEGVLVAFVSSDPSGAGDQVDGGSRAAGDPSTRGVAPADGAAGPAAVVGVVGWRDALLGRAGTLDVTAADPWADWCRRLRAAIVAGARIDVVSSLTDHAEPSASPVLPGRPDPSGVAAAPSGTGDDRSPHGELHRGRVEFPPRDDHVAVTLASMPARRPHLARVVATLLPQADMLAVHLNGYEDVPDFLDHPRVRVSRSQDRGDLRASGKAAFTDDVPDGYHLMVDDDIDYPDDYVRRLVAKVEQYDRRAVVGYHGVVLDVPVVTYFGQREVVHFGTDLREDRRVHVLGTGTVAMHTDTMRFGLQDLPTPVMVDIWFAVAAHRRGIPLVAVARPTRHLLQLEQLGATLFEEFRDDDSGHVAALRTLDLAALR